LTQNPSVHLREIPEPVRDALSRLGIPTDDIPVVVPADQYDQAVLLTQYRLVEPSMPVPFVHRVASMPHAPNHVGLASVVSAMLAASRLSRRGIFQLVVGTSTIECGLGHIVVRPARQNEGRPALSGPL
jgi:hypothetical protein